MNRQYEEVHMPLGEGATLLHPERALLEWGGDCTRSDIGQICYLIREKPRSQLKRRKFDLASFSSERAKVVRIFVVQFSEQMRLGGMRPKTVQASLRSVLEFVNWADRLGLHKVLCDKQATAEAFHRYVREKREQVSMGNLKLNTAARGLRELLSNLREFFSDHDFCANAKLLRQRMSASVPTDVPDAEAQAALLAWADSFFFSISALVLDFKPYPIRVTTEQGESLCLVPHTHVGRKGDSSRGLLGWNLDTGELRTREELQNRMAEDGDKHTAQRSRTIVLLTARLLTEANENAQSGLHPLL